MKYEIDNTKDPLVSVITPAFNAEQYIGQAIQSILDQTFKDFEYIILDDASVDRTWPIIESYSKKDARINAVRNNENLYIAGNRNKGVSMARGKYIVWQDADDISLTTRIEKLVGFMENHSDVGICGSYIQSFRNGEDLDVRKYATDDETLRKSIFKYSPVAQPAAIIRKRCYDEFGDYDLDLPPAEDIDMTFRIGTKYKFANIPEILLRYREHEDSATHKKLKKQIRATLKTRKKFSEGSVYEMAFSDRIAFFVTSFAQYLPPRMAVSLFKALRSFSTVFRL